MISSLLDGIVERLARPLTLAKLEGDAVFAYEDSTDRASRGQALLDCVADCYTDFRRRLDTAHAVWRCWCEACPRIDELDLKFVVHSGSFVIQDIAGGRELAGPEVVIAHRLLKSSGAEVAGRAFALVTAAAAERIELPTAEAISTVETYEHYAPIDAFVFPLHTT